MSGSLLLVASAAAQVTLKEAYKDRFLVGAALNEAQFTEANAGEAALVKAEFNSVTPENALKWEETEPRPGEYRFEAADRFVEFGVRHRMFVVGHVLVWHSQTPAWVFQDAHGAPADRATLLARMRDHIHTLVGRYRGRVNGWDVVNEALDDDGSLRDSPWRRIIGDDYIALAFRYAHEADPGAELYYNDYSIEAGPKRAGAVALLGRLLAAGVPVTAVGMQGHINLTWPSTRMLDEAIAAFGGLGLGVLVTELDVDVLPTRARDASAEAGRREPADPALDPYRAGLPDAVQQAFTRRYAELFATYARHPGVVRRVTLWGVTDAGSWLNDLPIRGRTSYPLLFDRAGQRKPAYDAVIRAAPPPDAPGAAARR